MAQISRRLLKKDTEDKINNLLWDAIVDCSSKELTAQFLEDLLTPTEKVMLAKRLAIAYLIGKNIPHLKIADILKVSYPTVRTVSILLRYKGNGLRSILAKVERHLQWRRLFDELVATSISIIGSGKGSNWKMTKRFEHEHQRQKQSPL